jgi:hypothetical protein
VPPSAVPAASTPWPLVVALVVVVVAVALWGLFRRGSVADRARRDEPSEDPAPGGHGTDTDTDTDTDAGT